MYGCYAAVNGVFQSLFGHEGRFVAFCIGLMVYACLMAILDGILSILYNVEKLGVFDNLMNADKYDNLTQPIGVLFFDKFEFKEMKDHILKKTTDIPRCRSKLTKIMGIWYF